MTAKIKWGIIGLGKIAHTFAEDLLRAPQTELAAVASRSAAKAQKFAAAFQVPAHFSSYQKFIENAAVDVVYIATPHPFHVALSQSCLQSGKAVLCEKPLAMNAAELEQLIKTANTSQKFLMEGLWTRFMPTYTKAMALIADGVLGEINHLEADFGFQAKYSTTGRLFNKQLGGGSLLDIGIYPLFLSLSVLGWPDNIKAQASFSATGVDEACTIHLEYAGGATAQLFSTFKENTPTQATIRGEKGSLKLHPRFHQSQQVSLYLNGRAPQHFELPYRGNGYIAEIEEVNFCLRKGLNESPKLPNRFSLELCQLLDAVRKEIDLIY